MAADVISQGYARYKNGKSLSVWKKRWIVFRRNSSKGPTRIEQFENEAIAQKDLIESLSHSIGHPHTTSSDPTVDSNNNRTNQHATEDNNFILREDIANLEATVTNNNNIIRRDNPDELQRDYYRKTCVLTNVLEIQRLSSIKHALVIKFHDGSKIKYAFSSNMEAECWLRLLTQECIPPPPVVVSGEPDLLVSGIQKELRERFRVYLMPTPKLEFFGDCLLQVTHENIYLWDVVDLRSKIAYWPLTALRRYGSDQNKFTFEAGRHCMTGEGRFDFYTFEGEKIYRKVHQATLAIAHAKTKTLTSQHAQQSKQQTGLRSSKHDAQKSETTPVSISIDQCNTRRFTTENDVKATSLVNSSAHDQIEINVKNCNLNDKRPVTPIMKRSKDNHYVSQSLMSSNKASSQVVNTDCQQTDNSHADAHDSDDNEELELEESDQFAADNQRLISNDSARTPQVNCKNFRYNLDYPIPPPIRPRTSKNTLSVDINNDRIV